MKLTLLDGVIRYFRAELAPCCKPTQSPDKFRSKVPLQKEHSSLQFRPLAKMSECNITVKNKTGTNGQEPVIVDFMLFQTVPNPTGGAWSAALKVDKLAYSSKISQIGLPSDRSDVSFYVIDEDAEDLFSLAHLYGPYRAKFGETLRIVQRQSTGTPEVIHEPQPARRNEIIAINDERNTKKLEFALFKKVNYGDKYEDLKVVSYKDICPGEQVSLAVKPAIFISDVSTVSVAEGGDFNAVDETKLATKFELKDNQLGVTIGIFQKSNGEIYFKEILKLFEEEPEYILNSTAETKELQNSHGKDFQLVPNNINKTEGVHNSQGQDFQLVPNNLNRTEEGQNSQGQDFQLVPNNLNRTEEGQNSQGQDFQLVPYSHDETRNLQNSLNKLQLTTGTKGREKHLLTLRRKSSLRNLGEKWKTCAHVMYAPKTIATGTVR